MIPLETEPAGSSFSLPVMPKYGHQTIFAESFFRLNAKLFAPFLSQAGLTERILHAPEQEIPAANYVALWEILGRRLDASIGLRLGLQSKSAALGAYGQAIRSAPSMFLALHCLSHFIVVFTQAARLEINLIGHQIIVSYQITDPTITARRQDAEFTLGFILNLLREITQNSSLTPERVDFEHAQPQSLFWHRRLLTCPLHFNQPDNRLLFPRGLLDMPVCTSDPRLFQALEPFLAQQRQIRMSNGDLLTQLKRHIVDNLSSGAGNLDRVAHNMGLSPRTLQRRLAKHQVEFKRLVDETRRALAEGYVAQPHYTLTEIALSLGYAECSSFSRAFRRWTHLTPQQYRSRAQLR